MTDYDDGNARDLAAQRKVREAARAMLAALKMVPRPGSWLSLVDKHQRYENVRAAIAQAEAAGIK